MAASRNSAPIAHDVLFSLLKENTENLHSSTKLLRATDCSFD
jgi:hypothetical protein